MASGSLATLNSAQQQTVSDMIQEFNAIQSMSDFIDAQFIGLPDSATASFQSMKKDYFEELRKLTSEAAVYAFASEATADQVGLEGDNAALFQNIPWWNETVDWDD